MIGLHTRRTLRWTGKPRPHPGDTAVLVGAIVAFVVLFVCGLL